MDIGAPKAMAKYKRLLTLFVAAVIIVSGYLLYREATPQPSNTDNLNSTQMAEIDYIRQAIYKSFGQQGFPELYPHPRSFDINDYIYRYDEKWLAVGIDLLDESPRSDFRNIIYVIKKAGNSYEVVANSNFPNTQTPYPADIPNDLIEEISEVHG